MKRIPVADWAASVPWAGIQGLPAGLTQAGGVQIELSQIKQSGATTGQVPRWNGTRWVPFTLPSSSSGGGSGTTIEAGESPGVAVRRRPPGDPSGQYQNIWARDRYNVKLYGATGDGGTDDSDAVNAIINAVNSDGFGSIYFPAGTYRIPSMNPITAPCEIHGDGPGVTILEFDGGQGIEVSLSSSGNATVSNLSISNVGVGYSQTGGLVFASELYVTAGTRGVDLNAVSGGFVANSILVGDGAAVNAVSVAAGTSLLFANIYADGFSGAAIALDASTEDCRVSNILLRDIGGSSAVSDLGTNNYVNELVGLGGNTDTKFDSRRELIATYAFDPASLNPGQALYEDVPITGLQFGDQLALGNPAALGGLFSNIEAVYTGTARISLLNIGTSAVDLSNGTWKIRAFN